MLSPRRGSGVGVVYWTSEARDIVGRRLSLSCTYNNLNFSAAWMDGDFFPVIVSDVTIPYRLEEIMGPSWME